MILEHQILSKVLDDKNFFVLKKHNIRKEDFIVLQDVYEFIYGYVRKNQGSLPDYRTIVNNYDHFEYVPEVADTFGYLCKSLKQNTAKRMQYELFQKQLPEKFSQLNGLDLNKWALEELGKIANITEAISNQGTNFATNGLERLQWFEDSKDRRTNIFIPTPYPTLTKLLAGGFELGDYVLLNAFTNRGKSWLASQMGLSGWMAGFGVLHYSPELSKKQQANRLDTLMGHFNNVGLRNGELENEEQFRNYLLAFNDQNNTPYIVKTMEDLPDGLSTDVIEADILMNPDIKMVIIDGFNLMTHKGKDGNRNNMSNTSRQLRQIFGRHEVVGLVVHQTPQSAEKENSANKDEAGRRMVKPPEIHQFSETIATIQDPSTVLAFDQLDGLGKLKITKCRQPAVGEEIDLNCNFNLGFIEETHSFGF